VQIIVEAHSDNKGDLEIIQKLTQDRAEALAGRLVSAGVDSMRIRAAGMGSSTPVSPNTTPAGRARNRRIEIMLVPAASDSAESVGRN
jgi:outer membrane protein OmpA-like peptidoglycan-associated protein